MQNDATVSRGGLCKNVDDSEERKIHGIYIYVYVYMYVYISKW